MQRGKLNYFAKYGLKITCIYKPLEKEVLLKISIFLRSTPGLLNKAL